ncbi:PKD domain-containing protein [Rhodoflexus sp.]
MSIRSLRQWGWLWLLLLCMQPLWAQLINNRTNITIRNGGLLHVNGDFQNANNGSTAIDAGATLRVSGSFSNLNTATVPSLGTLSLGGNLSHQASNGLFTTEGLVLLNGTGNQLISATLQNINFFRLELNKPSGEISLARAIDLRNRLLLSSGRLNLSGFDLNLLNFVSGSDEGGFLENETNANRVYGNGLVRMNLPAFAPNNILTNLRGTSLGISTGGANMGTTQIWRGHTAFPNAADGSIVRYFGFNAANAANAQVRLGYVDDEVAGNENNYALFVSPDGGGSFQNFGGTPQAASNFLESTTAAPIGNNTILTLADANCANAPRLADNPDAATPTTSATTGQTVEVYVIQNNPLTLRVYNDLAADGNGANLIDARWSGAFVSHTFPTLNLVQTHTVNTSTVGRFLYTVTLTNARGCTNTRTYAVNVFPRFIPDFTTTNACVGGNHDFTTAHLNTALTADLTAAGYTAVYTTEWDFIGAGSSPTTRTLTDQASHADTHTRAYTTAGVYNVRLRLTVKYRSVGVDRITLTDEVTKSVEVRPLPTPDFNFTQVCQGAASNFTIAGTPISSPLVFPGGTPSGMPVSIATSFWQFGDGNTLTNTGANALNAVNHTYTAAGVYTVRLTMTSAQGCVAFVEKTVEVRPNPVPAFDATTVCAGASTTFTNNSNIASPVGLALTPAIVQSEWIFGDSNSQTVAGADNVSHTYAAPGRYMVTLRTTSNATPACVTEITQAVDVYPVPVAAFTKTDVCAGTPTTFTNASTIAQPLGLAVLPQIATAVWDFGDGNTQTLTGANALDLVNHTYAAAGVYTVTLTVTSNAPTAPAACSHTVTQTVEVRPNPVADFAFMNDLCFTGAGIEFLNFSDIADPGGLASTPEIVEARWNFGDGSPILTESGADALNSVSHTYAAAGVYTVTLTVISNTGCQAVQTENITLHPQPVPNFTFTQVCHNAPTTFTNASTVPTPIGFGTAPQIVTSLWNFGDGNTQTLTGANAMNAATHTYANPGVYTVRLTVTTDAPNACTQFIEYDVEVRPNPVAVFTSAGAACIDPAGFTFTNTSTIASVAGLAATPQIVESRWNFGDGSPLVVLTGANALDAVTHVYALAGTYPVTLTVVSNTGCTHSTTQNFTVYPLPTAAFTAANICKDSPLTFVNTSTGANALTTSVWNFGDGSPAVTLGGNDDATHTYTTFGTFTVTLTVTDVNGCTHQTTQNITIHPRPVPAFTVSALRCETEAITFTNTTNTFAAATTYVWDFGDSTTSTDESPVKTYATAGSYTVTLTALNGFGCTDVFTQNVIVHPKPVLNLGGVIGTCAPNLTLDAENPGSSYLWSTGATTQTINVTTSGIYSVTITSPQGCAITETVEVQLLATVNANLGPDREECGETFLDARNPGSTYLWNTGATTRFIRVTETGTYSVTVTDPAGCQETDEIFIRIKKQPFLQFAKAQEILCRGEKLTLQPSFNQNAVRYLWSTGATTRAIEVDKPGEYTLTIFSEDNCSATSSVNVIIGGPEPFEFPKEINKCFGEVEVLDARNLAPGTTFRWSDGSRNRTLTVRQSGDYWVEVSKDGCTIRRSVKVTFADEVKIPENQVEICSDETAVLDAGNPGSRYLWSTGATTQTIQARIAGVYRVQITTAQGCVSQHEIRLNIKPRLRVDLGTDRTSCEPVVLDAGNAGARFRWSDGSTTQTLRVTRSGTYSVTVTRDDACEAQGTVTITIREPEMLTPTELTICEGDSETLTGGEAQSYRWSTGATTRSISVAQAGSYRVEMTDAEGCVRVQDFVVRTRPKLTVDLGANQVSCTPVTLNAGNAGARFRWSDGSTTQTLRVTRSGIYSVTVMRDGFCEAKASVTITIEEPALEVTLGDDKEICEGESVTLDAGNPGMSYEWSTGETTRTITVARAGIYRVRVRNGQCVATDEIEVKVNPLPQLQLPQEQQLCEGNSLELEVNAQAGVQYNWTREGGNFTASGSKVTISQTGRYTVTATSDKGCVTTRTINIIRNPQSIEAQFLSQSEVGVNEEVQFINVSHPAPTRQEWNFGDGNRSTALNPTHRYSREGTFEVTLKVSNGICENIRTKRIIVQRQQGGRLPNDGLAQGAPPSNASAFKGIVEARVFPNPARSKFTLDVKMGDEAAVRMQFYDLRGIPVSETFEVKAKDFSREFDFGHLPTGLYLLKITSDDHSLVLRVMKE